jgi:hypothetical protein
MTRRSPREIERLLRSLEPSDDPDDGIHVIGNGETDRYATAEEFEARHGYSPAESVGLVIRVPPGAEEY